MNRPHFEKACEEIDASVFSSDMLFDDDARTALHHYIKRWLRAIYEHRLELSDSLSKQENQK